MADALDTIGDASDFLGSLNAVLNPLVSSPGLPQALAQGLLPGLDTCLTQLVAGLALAQSSGLGESGSKQYILDALVNPVRDVLTELFVPDAAAFEGMESFADYAQEFGEQLLQSLKNPIAAILAMQKQVLQSSLASIGDKLYGGDTAQQSMDQRGLLGEVYDRVHFAVSTLIVGGDDGAGLGGLIVFALQQGIPAIDSEIRYLKQMKRALRTSAEQASRIPDAIVPQLPALGAVNSICSASEDLDAVAAQLRRDKTWNRSRFEAARKNVCESADILRRGIVPDNLDDLLKNVVGLDQRQLNALKKATFMPDPRFRLSLIQLVALNGFAQQQDVLVLGLHNNLINVISVLESVLSVHIADILALIIEVLRNQIQAVQADLEAQARGFTGNLASSMPDSVTVDGKTVQLVSNPPRVVGVGSGIRVEAVRGEVPIEGSSRRNTKYAVDVFAQMSGQAAAYTVLQTLCYLMGSVRQIYNGLDRVLTGNTKIMKTILKYVSYYKEHDCGPSNGAQRVANALDSYMTAAESRMRGDTPNNQALATRAERLRAEIDSHIEWLQCIRLRMVFGNETFAQALILYTNLLSAVRNIGEMVRQFRQLYEAFATLDIRKIFGLDDVEYNAIDVILRAIQCFVLQCNNPYLRAQLELAAKQFKAQKNQKLSGKITMTALDAVSKNSDRSNLNTRIAALIRLIQMIQRLSALDINNLCNIDTSPQRRADTPPPLPADTSLDEVGVSPELAREQEELLEQWQAAQRAAPFEPFPQQPWQPPPNLA